MAAAGKDFEAMFNDKKHDFIFVTKKPKEKEYMVKMIGAFQEHMKNIQDKIISKIKNLPKKVVIAIGFATEEGASLPNGFFTEFEVRRIEFNNSGYLK